MTNATEHANAMLIEAIRRSYRDPSYIHSLVEGVKARRAGYISRDVALLALELSYADRTNAQLHNNIARSRIDAV